jgi:ankyrin repeat protein
MKNRLLTILLAFAICGPLALAQSGTLFTAARTNDVKLVQALIDNRADIDQQDEKGYTPLILATYNGSYEVAELLLKHHAATEKKDRSGRTALMGAAYKGDEREITLLLDNGADINATDSKGLTSMMYAVMFARISAIKTLRAYNASKAAAPLAKNN